MLVLHAAGRSAMGTCADIPLGLYELPRRSGEAHLYRLNHPLGEAVVARARGATCRQRRYASTTPTTGKVSMLEPLIGRAGRLRWSLVADASKRWTRRRTT